MGGEGSQATTWQNLSEIQLMNEGSIYSIDKEDLQVKKWIHSMREYFSEKS